jgi:hypothetical protein
MLLRAGQCSSTASFHSEQSPIDLCGAIDFTTLPVPEGTGGVTECLELLYARTFNQQTSKFDYGTVPMALKIGLLLTTELQHQNVCPELDP